MIAAASIVSSMNGFYSARMCGQVDYMMGQNRTLANFPDCAAYYSGEDPEKYVMVRASMKGNRATVASALGISFGPAMWLALALHAIGIEVYVRAASIHPPKTSHPVRIRVDYEAVLLTQVEFAASTHPRRARETPKRVVPTTTGGRNEVPWSCWSHRRPTW